MHLDFNYQDLDYISINDKVELSWNRVWSNRGHNIGEGMVSPDKKHFYLNIPKNSSSSIKKILHELNWTYGHVGEFPNAQIIVAFRDPIKRWASGAAEYLMMYQQGIIDNIVEPNLYDFMPLLGDKLGMSLLFDRMTFDDHTERQAVFMHDVPLSRCVGVMIDKNFNNTFSALLTELGYSNNFNTATMENSTEDVSNSKKRKLKEFLSFVIDRDEYKKYNLTQWFWCDYELIKQIKFYGR